MPSYKILDFGPVAEKHSHSRELKIINLNPLPIFIQRIRSTIPTCGNETPKDEY